MVGSSPSLSTWTNVIVVNNLGDIANVTVVIDDVDKCRYCHVSWPGVVVVEVLGDVAVDDDMGDVARCHCHCHCGSGGGRLRHRGVVVVAVVVNAVYVV